MERLIQQKLCECGCGNSAPIAVRTSTKKGHVRGMPVRFIVGHQYAAKRKSTRYIPEDRGYATSCWIWKMCKTWDGYGRVRHGGIFSYAHLVLWEEQNGQVPLGLQLDHLCRVRDCVNPSHLECVTSAENTRRGILSRRLTAPLVSLASGDRQALAIH